MGKADIASTQEILKATRKRTFGHKLLIGNLKIISLTEKARTAPGNQTYSQDPVCISWTKGGSWNTVELEEE